MSDRRRGRNNVELLAQKVLKTDGITNKQRINVPVGNIGDHSLHFWYKNFAFPVGKDIGLYNVLTLNTATQFASYGDSSNIYFFLWKNGVYKYTFNLPISSVFLNNNQWNFFSLVADQNTVKLSVNNVVLYSGSCSNNGGNIGNTFNFGALDYADGYVTKGEFARIALVKKAITTFPTSPVDDAYYSDLTDYQFLIEGNIDRVGATVTAVNSPSFPDLIYP